MKKLVSVLLTIFIAFSQFSNFAVYAEVSENLKAVFNPITVDGIKLFPDGTTVNAKITETDEAYVPLIGDSDEGKLVDGIGMIGTAATVGSKTYRVLTDIDMQTGLNDPISVDQMIPQSNRFSVLQNSAPTVEITIPEKTVMNSLYLTQVKRVVNEYSVEYYNEETQEWEEVADGSLATSNEEISFIDQLPLEKEIVATKIRFIVKSVLQDEPGWLCELGYGYNYSHTAEEITTLPSGKLKLAAKTFVDDDMFLHQPNISVTAIAQDGQIPKGVGQEDTSIEAMFDGIGMVGTRGTMNQIIGDRVLVENTNNPMKNRFIAFIDNRATNANPPITITITPLDENETIAFDEIRLTEMRSTLAKCIVRVKGEDGSWIKVKEAEFTDESTRQETLIRKIKLDKVYETTSVQFIAEKMSGLNTSFQLTEMELYKSSDQGNINEVACTINGTDASLNLERAFDNNEKTTYSCDVSSALEPIEISFKASNYKIADTMMIDSENIDSITLKGSIDGENYFDIPVTKEGKYYYFAGEFVSAAKIFITPADGTDTLTIKDIGLYENGGNEELHLNKSLFDGGDTSYITDEKADTISSNIICPLPDSIGNYTVSWRSEDSSKIDVETGVIAPPTYVPQSVEIYADFMRDGDVYKTNTYKLTIKDDGSLEKTNKFHYTQGKIENLSKHVISSKVWDADNLDPTNRGDSLGTTMALYDESNKTGSFSSANTNSWATYEMTGGVAKFTAPYTFEFEFDMPYAMNNLDFYEWNNRINVAHLEVSTDGEVWTAITENITLNNNPTTISENFYKKNLSFPTCYVKYVRLIIDEIAVTTKYAAFKLCEVVFYNLVDEPSVNEESAALIADRDASTYFELDSAASFVLDMTEISGFDSIKWVSSGEAIKDYTVSVSNDKNLWKTVSSGALTDDISDSSALNLTTLNFDYQIARYIRLDIESIYSDGSISIAELYVAEESADEQFVTEKRLARLFENDDTGILIDEKLKLLTSDTVNLVTSVDNYSLTWDVSKAPFVDAVTGAVTHYDEDVSGTVAVEVIDTDNNTRIYGNIFPIISRAVLDINDYYKADSKDSLVDASYDFSRPENFKFNQDGNLVEFNVSENGEFALESDAALVMFEKNDNEITVKYKDATETVKCFVATVGVRVVLYEDSFDLYMNYDNTRYKGIIAEGKYLSDFSNGIKNLRSDSSEISNISLYIKKDSISKLLDQFDFSHISSESMYNVTENLDLKSEIIGLPITWTSSNPKAINPSSGEVDVSVEAGYVTLTMSVNEENVVEWNKNLYVSVNMPNIISEASIDSNAVSYDGNVITNTTDAKMETSYLTSYKNGYTIQVNFSDTKLISQIALIEDNTLGSINSYNIYVDENKVYQGGKVNEFSCCVFDAAYGKKVKIEVTSSEGISGLREIGIHSELTDEQRIKMDLSSVMLTSNYQNGEYNLTKTGNYGTTLAYSSSKNIVSFEDCGSYVKMTVDNQSVAQSVTITVTSSYNDSPSHSKPISIIANGTKEISINPSEGSSSGGTGGGGGGGKGSLFGGTVSADNPIAYVPETAKDEISGHWAEKEIRSLIEKEIVQGDGNGFNLSKTVSRAEFITMLLRATEKELSANEAVFGDISAEDWYADEIQTAYELGWIEGYNNMANPQMQITREEMAKIICKAIDAEVVNEMTLEFTDKNEQSLWAVEYINTLYNHNIIKGYEDGSYRPKSSLKRDEAMVIVYRIINKEVK